MSTAEPTERATEVLRVTLWQGDGDYTVLVDLVAGSRSWMMRATVSIRSIERYAVATPLIAKDTMVELGVLSSVTLTRLAHAVTARPPLGFEREAVDELRSIAETELYSSPYLRGAGSYVRYPFHDWDGVFV